MITIQIPEVLGWIIVGLLLAECIISAAHLYYRRKRFRYNKSLLSMWERKE